MFKKSPLKATKLHQRKRRARMLKITFIVVAILLVFGATVWISYFSFLRFDKVVVKGNVAIDSADIEAVAQKHLAGAYGSIYAKSNKLIYPKDEIEADILASFPSINTLAIEAEGKALQVSLTERKPAYIWCKGTPQTKTTDDCYFMDASGAIFSKGPQVSGNAYFTFYGLITDEDPIGKVFLSEEMIKGIDMIKNTLDQNNVEVNAFITNEDKVNEIILTKGGKIVFKADQDPAITSSSISLLKKKTKLLDQTGTSTLEYIDLRFGNKVYYKYIGDNAVQSEQ